MAGEPLDGHGKNADAGKGGQTYFTRAEPMTELGMPSMLYTRALALRCHPLCPHAPLMKPFSAALVFFLLMLTASISLSADDSSATTTAPTNSVKTVKKPSVQAKAKLSAKSPAKRTIKRSVRSAHPVSHPPTVAASEFANFTQWQSVREFIDGLADQDGFDRERLQQQFRQTRYLESVVQLINPPPASKAKNWTAYRGLFIEPKRIQAGVAFWSRHQQALNRAYTEFGVPPEIIVGIIGVETLYGQNTGKTRVIDALTTLAFAYPDTPNRVARSQYFRSELRQLFLYARENTQDVFSFYGSFAGAIGWPQFMPGSIRRYAVDFDGDGVIDLRNSPLDAIGSVASFLSQHGWRMGLPLTFEIKEAPRPDTSWAALAGQGLAANLSPDYMRAAGLSWPSDAPLGMNYGLVDLQDGERPVQYWLATQNFYAITQYNRSFYYAMAVIGLGQAVSQQRAP